MKKYLFLVVILSIFTLSVDMAQAHRNNNVNIAENTSTDKPARNNSVYYEIKEKYCELEKVRNHSSQLYHQIKQQNDTNTSRRNGLNLEKKWNDLSVIRKTEEQIKDIGSQNYELIKKRLELQSKLSRAYLNKDTDAINALKSQLSSINEKIREKENETRIHRNNLKKAQEESTPLWDKIKKVNDKIKLLQSQMANLESEIYTLRASKEKEWTKFYTAMRKNDLTDARTCMDSITVIENQTLEKLKGILELKKEIENILKDFE